MTVIGALSSFRELGEMSPHKRAQVHRFTLTGCRLFVEVTSPNFDVQLASKMPRFGGGFWGLTNCKGN